MNDVICIGVRLIGPSDSFMFFYSKSFIPTDFIGKCSIFSSRFLGTGAFGKKKENPNSVPHNAQVVVVKISFHFTLVHTIYVLAVGLLIFFLMNIFTAACGFMFQCHIYAHIFP
ncbi:hypothetical protein ACJX0J_029639 [Zea mays]